MNKIVVSKIIYSTLLLLIISCSKSEDSNVRVTTKFSDVLESKSGITFKNTIKENDSLNYFKFPYMYMGAGVAIGDINNDGLSDVFFTGNIVSNALYLNKGNLNFQDITKSAGVAGDNRWYTGVTMTDINNDGFLDIYLCVSGMGDNTENQLLVNNGDNTFTESASDYGINDKSNSIQSTFFDYDKDGDIDLFVANYPSVPISQGNMYYYEKMKENNPEESGHLYRNDGNGKFTDVTKLAGLQKFGLTLGLISSDFNNDGWQDIYLSNDFNVPDYFYINNQDGTFTEVVKEVTGHISMFGMGIDASDFNNDGLTDLIQAEMSPEDYIRARVNMASMNPKNFNQGVDLGFHYQYMQNSLQLNRGISKNGIPQMSEISRYANMSSTDWSWSTLFADLDNDGWKDIYITNGMKRDVNDNDVNNKIQPTSFKQVFNIEITDYPSEPIANYVYRNKGGFDFEKIAKKWNLDFKGFSNGMAYGDLDNDGDLDLVISNLDQKASLFKNETKGHNYLRISLKGTGHNPLGLGAKVIVKSTQGEQIQEQLLTRGFQSSVEPIIHFGLGNQTEVDSVKIVWLDGAEQVLINPKINQVLEVHHSNSVLREKENLYSKPPFDDITKKSKIEFKHTEDLFDDYNLEPLLPYKYSMLGGTVSVGDANGDGLEDFYVGNAGGSQSKMYLQEQDSTFKEWDGPWLDDMLQEDTGSVFYDFDNDGDQDLYVCSGGNKYQNLADRLYINSNNTYLKSENSLPVESNSTKAIALCDFNKDGLMDVFVGGRNIPGKYPFASTSLLLKNLGGKDENIKFEVVKNPFGENSDKLGMVTDAIWADLDGDSWEELIIVGEWMPITIYKNDKGKLKNETNSFGFENTKGWWYALSVNDIDNDGDLDIIAGNLGLNHKYKASKESPFEVYSRDFDENGSNDIVFTYNKKGKQVPLRGRECSSQQVPAIAVRYKTYRDFAKADLNEIYGKSILNKALHYEVDMFGHQWFENKNGNTFIPHSLPQEVQLSTINSITSINYNDDEFTDFLVFGNLFQSEAETPRSDSGLGIVLLGSKNGLKAVSSSQSGLFLRTDTRECEEIILSNKSKAYLLTSNNEDLKLLKLK